MNANTFDSLFNNNKKIKIIFMHTNKETKSKRGLRKNESFNNKYIFTIFGYGKDDSKFDYNSDNYYGDNRINLYNENKDKNLLMIFNFDFYFEDKKVAEDEKAYALYIPDNISNFVSRK